MTCLRLLLLIVILPICVAPAQAQIFRKKAAPSAPSAAVQRVPQLILTLKTDKENGHRATAIEELSGFDLQTYQEILPVLVEAALRDAAASVRTEAISALARMRPITKEAGQAIAKAASSDENLRVRVHARTTLWRYQLAGYGNDSTALANIPRRTTAEPPMHEKTPVAPAVGEQQAGPALGAPELPVIEPAAEEPRPLPRTSSFSTAFPQNPRLITSQPAAGHVIIQEEPPPLPAP